MKYLVYEASLRHILDNDPGDNEPIYSLYPDKNSGNRDVNDKIAYLKITSYRIEQICERAVEKAFLSGCTEKIETKVLNDVLDTKIVCVLNDECGVINIYDSYEDTIIDVRDEKKLKKMLRTTAFRRYDGSMQYVHNIYVFVSVYSFRGLTRRIQQAIKKTLRNYVFCIRNGVSIIPEEYTKRGTQGIAEWQEYCRSKRKGYSLENQILKTSLKGQKQKFQKVFRIISQQVVNPLRQNYTYIQLSVYGLYNKTRLVKTCNEILKDKSTIEVLNMTTDDMIKLASSYWVSVFQVATTSMAKIDVEEIERTR